RLVGVDDDDGGLVDGKVEITRPTAVRVDGVRPRGTKWLKQGILSSTSEDRRRAAEPDVSLRDGALGAEAVVDLLGAHVEPAHIHLGMELLEAPLTQRQQVAAVRGVDDEGGSVPPGAADQDQRQKRATSPHAGFPTPTSSQTG